MSKQSMERKAFNATADGQKAMFEAAGFRSTVFLLNKKIRELGGDSPFLDSEIEKAPVSMMEWMRDTLIPIYNELVRWQSVGRLRASLSVPKSGTVER